MWILCIFFPQKSVLTYFVVELHCALRLKIELHRTGSSLSLFQPTQKSEGKVTLIERAGAPLVTTSACLSPLLLTQVHAHHS